MIRYMHTLNGVPANFYERDGVCFSAKAIKLADSLKQIRMEQKKCQEMRRKKGRSPDSFLYGYVTVQV